MEQFLNILAVTEAAMIRAKWEDKKLVAQILLQAFEDNKSINYIIKQDNKRRQRIRNLINYSFDVCYHYGEIFLSNDKKGCALILLPEKKKVTIKSVLLDLQLIFTATGFGNIRKAMKREARIKTGHPKGLLYYLWFIGVAPSEQNKGTGSKLLNDLIVESQQQRRTICLETSTLKNIPWYQKFGFEIYDELNFGYTLYCLKKV
jgi:hypothetical protein